MKCFVGTPIGLVMIVLLVAGCGNEGATEFSGSAPSPDAVFGQCAFCHPQMAINMLPSGQDLKCETCHADQTPGFVGPGHRSIPGADLVPSFVGATHHPGPEGTFGSCAFCHNDKARNLSPYAQDVHCETCHDNAQPGFYGPGHRTIPGADRVPSFPGPAHQLGAEAEFGVCAYCHNQLTVTATVSTHGSMSLNCQNCHTSQATGTFGPGHQSVPACADCHQGQKTHNDPAAGTKSECVVCHTPHGSTNLFLVREQILTPSGTSRDVTLTNLSGQADGSFASVTAEPPNGVCQVCHTTTRFYRSDGSGDQHFPFACFTCHHHAAGFEPQ
jgi:predicted CXXCH cytochrome family protein